MGASTYVQDTVKGALIILAVSIEFFRPRERLSPAVS
jgi:ribose/xylose/arabinose/galactoside ABC-type transport system permease subunit